MAYILIIDDDPDICEAIKLVLFEEKYEADISDDLDKAFEKMKKRKPDLILLDVMFPDDDSGGFVFAQNLRNHDEFKDIPILMLTAVNQEFSFDFSSEDIDDEWLPVSDFIEKPADFEILKEKVSKLLGN